MARKAMVTRTITTTKVNVLCMDIVKCEPFNKDVVLPRTYKDEEKVLAKLRKLCDTDTEKVVSITSIEEVETLYGMDEQSFIDNAVVLDPETRKILEDEETNTEE